MNNNINDDIGRQVYLEDTFDFTRAQQIPQTRSKSRNQERIISYFITAAIVVASIAVLFQAYSIGKHLYTQHQNNKQAEHAQTVFDETIMRQAFTTPPPAVQSLDITETGTPSRRSAKAEIRPEILLLREELGNEDIIGYIIIENTNIKYPIVQTTDNEFYLTHDVLKNKNASGAIFLDCSNTIELTDKNSVIYGQNMRNKTMFYDLQSYVDKDYLKAHPNVLVVTPYDETVWEIFSAYSTEASFNFNQTSFDDSSPYLPFLKRIFEKSFVSTGVKVSEYGDDIVLTLASAANAPDDIVYVVHAKLVERK